MHISQWSSSYRHHPRFNLLGWCIWWHWFWGKGYSRKLERDAISYQLICILLLCSSCFPNLIYFHEKPTSILNGIYYYHLKGKLSIIILNIMSTLILKFLLDYITGLIRLFRLLYTYLLIDGNYRLPYAWFERRVTNYLKPSNTPHKLKSGHMHHPRHTNSKIRTNANTNSQCYWSTVSVFLQQKDA